MIGGGGRDAVGELDACDDHRQAVSSFSLRQNLAAAMMSLKTISRAVLCDRAPLIPHPHRSVPDGGEDALNGVGRAQMIPNARPGSRRRPGAVHGPSQAKGGLGDAPMANPLLEAVRPERLSLPTRPTTPTASAPSSPVERRGHTIRHVRSARTPSPSAVGSIASATSLNVSSIASNRCRALGPAMTDGPTTSWPRSNSLPSASRSMRNESTP